MPPARAKNAPRPVSAAFTSVSLPNDIEFLRRRSSQLSVGQAQRVIIAMAILHRPGLLIADEATSALDTITQSEILGLFARLNRELGMGVLYISHDLLSVATLCHRIAILNSGESSNAAPLAKFSVPPACLHAETSRRSSRLPELLDPDLLCFHARRGTRSHSLLGPFRVRRLAARFSPVHPEPSLSTEILPASRFHES